MFGVLGGANGFAQPATRPDSEEDSPTTQPDEIRRGMRMGDPSATRYRRYWENLARQIEPELKGDISKLDAYSRFFEREIIHDRRVFAWEVHAHPDTQPGGRTLISGVAEFREQVDAFIALLDTLGMGPVRNIVELAPTSPVRFPIGSTTAANCFVRANRDLASEKTNQVLANDYLFLIARSQGNPDAYLCHTPDGYVGWVSAENVGLITPDLLAARLDRPGHLQTKPPDAVIAEARKHVGKPYVWGGRSDDGLDCSGLVQRAFAAAGVNLPRDAEQQALVGKLVAIRWHRDALRRGDTLYFLGRRGFIAHTAIYLGEGQMIESADGGVKISEFKPGSRRWESFCFGKRILE